MYNSDNFDYSTRARVAKYYLLYTFFFFDCIVISIKILLYGCTIYPRIHFAISFLLFLAVRLTLKSIKKRSGYNTKSNVTKNISQGTILVKKNPVLAEQHPFHMVSKSAFPFFLSFFCF